MTRPRGRPEVAIGLGADPWSGSCGLRALRHAAERGAVGTVCDPSSVLEAFDEEGGTWRPFVRELTERRPSLTPDETAWKLIQAIAAGAAALLEPVHRRTSGAKGLVAVHVDPRLSGDHAAMVAHAKALCALAPNALAAVPCTPAGLAAMEELAASALPVAASLAPSLSHAAAAAEAFECGLLRAEARGLDVEAAGRFVLLPVGSIDDHVRRSAGQGAEALAGWAGVAIFKRAYALFRERGYRCLLVASELRDDRHWSELAGEGLALSMLRAWWEAGEAASALPRGVAAPVDPSILAELQRLEGFRKAHEPGALPPGEFELFPPAAEGLAALLASYSALLNNLGSGPN